MAWWDSSVYNKIKISGEYAHRYSTRYYKTTVELTAEGNADLIVVGNEDGVFYFDFWSAHDIKDCKITYRYKADTCNSDGVVTSEGTWSENITEISNIGNTISYSNMNTYVNDSTMEGEGEYLTFSSFLNSFTEESYTNFLAETPLKYYTSRVANLISLTPTSKQEPLAFNISVESESGRIFYTKSSSNYLNRLTKETIKEVRKAVTTYSFSNFGELSNTLVNAKIAKTFRYDIIPYLIDDFEKYKDGDGKPFFTENVITKIKYDGTKKASLIIKHHFNLEEFQDFAEPTEIYPIPGYFINLAVNIRTVDPISGDNVNVYNLHKIDLPRDGFTKIAEVNENGVSKDYTYTYGDLVKACNNSTLGFPMKISVNIVQFADAKDGEPYVIYETPITDEIEINPVQHLYDGNTPASGITNSIEWAGYDGTDDGENSGGDGKNDDKGDKSGGTGSGQGTHNVLTTTYVSNATRLQALGDFLWSSNFLDNILLVNNNPIENVISVKMFPFTLPTGAESTIVLGNVDTEVPTNKLPDNYNYYHVYGSVKVPSYYNSFMDYAPFTRILLYLPFYGTLELDNSLIIDRVLKIAYIVDVVTGACTIDIYADDSLINVISCQVGIDIPITSSNRAQVETAILSNTLTSAVSGATVGGVVGAVAGGVGGALMNAGHCKYTTQTSGTLSSATELYNVSVPMLIIDRPKYREISGFAHNKGKMCMLTKKLSEVSGFSIFDRNIDLSGIGCTETESEMLRDLLSSGVYL